MHIKASASNWSARYGQEYNDEDQGSDEEFDAKPPDFSEYLWMENEEEFDKRELQRLEDEERMQECLDAMLHDEIEAQIDEWERRKCAELNAALSSLTVKDCKAEESMLNPLAAEFVPKSQSMKSDFVKS